MNKPTTLEIVAKNGRLIGTDENGRSWVIRWVGNGQHSHWNISPNEDLGQGWYLYLSTNSSRESDKLLEAQIRAAEHKYKIYT